MDINQHAIIIQINQRERLHFIPINLETYLVILRSFIFKHREIFSKSYSINLKSDCIYHFPIDLEQQTDTVRLLFQINRKMVYTI